MLYQLPDGRTVEISIEDFLSFSDEELKGLIGYSDVGDHINNPLYGSAITKPGRFEPEDEIYSDFDVPDVPAEEKFKDQDYVADDE